MKLYNIVTAVLAAVVQARFQPNAVGLDTGLFYDEYLQGVLKILEKDENLKNKMEEDIAEHGGSSHLKINSLVQFDEINDLAKHLRDELDDLKRSEVERVRKLLKAENRMLQGKKVDFTALVDDIAGHMDAENMENFGMRDLSALIKRVAKDMDSFDEKRHQRFKEYEMHKALEREERMESMTAQERELYEQEELEKRRKHDQHDNIPHPFSKSFLVDVWNSFGHLKGEDFNAKTFFLLHDVNGDGFIDTFELEAIFQPELDKLYDPNNPEDDMVEMEEERSNMREHVMRETDNDGDTAISLAEFLSYTTSDEFLHPSNRYVMIDDKIRKGELYTSEELQKYRQKVRDHEAKLMDRLAKFREEALDLAQKRKDFIVLKHKSDELGDDTVKRAVHKTENDLNSRHLNMMGNHGAMKEHAEYQLKMHKDLANQQIKAHVWNETDFQGMSEGEVAEYKAKFDELTLEMNKMLNEKAAHYMKAVEEAKQAMEKSSEFIHQEMLKKHKMYFGSMMEERKRAGATMELKKKHQELKKHESSEL